MKSKLDITTVDNESSILDCVADYYTQKLAEHGETPLGVDWNSEESQVLRFQQIAKVIKSPDQHFTISDIGCGYGALYKFLKENYKSVSYYGVDVSEKMVTAASDRYKNDLSAKFVLSQRPEIATDYAVASGIFNVRLEHNDKNWLDHIISTLDIMHQNTVKGFAFNCLTSYSDNDKKRDYLYYADPLQLFDLCKKKYSKNVALLHDYGLYEFTMIVRKSA